MKSFKHLFERVCCFSNLHRAYRKARRGKRDKAEAFRFDHRQEEELIALGRELTGRTCGQAGYRSLAIFDPKRRVISAAPFHEDGQDPSGGFCEDHDEIESGHRSPAPSRRPAPLGLSQKPPDVIVIANEHKGHAILLQQEDDAGIQIGANLPKVSAQLLEPKSGGVNSRLIEIEKSLQGRANPLSSLGGKFLETAVE